MLSVNSSWAHTWQMTESIDISKWIWHTSQSGLWLFFAIQHSSQCSSGYGPVHWSVFFLVWEVLYQFIDIGSWIPGGAYGHSCRGILPSWLGLTRLVHGCCFQLANWWRALSILAVWAGGVSFLREPLISRPLTWILSRVWVLGVKPRCD